MNLKLAVALFALFIALSCTRSGSNSGQDGELHARTNPVQVGEIAPNFNLEDQNGQKVSLSSLRGNAPTVLAFYRGNW